MLRKGLYVPMITPFHEGSEELWAEAMGENAVKLCRAGVAGLMPLGSNGEYKSLSDEEALRVLNTVAQAVSGRTALLAGAGRESAFSTLRWIERCKDAGIDAVFVLTPSFFSKTVGEGGLLRFYTKVADESPLPILLYAAPKYAGGVELPPSVVGEMAQHPNCVGMKDSSSQPTDVYARYQSEKFQVLAGSQGKLFDWMRAGAVGGVLSSANYQPEICVRLMRSYENGVPEQPHALDLALRLAGKTISGRFGVAGVKAAATLSGFAGGVARNPFGVLNDAEIQDVGEALTVLTRA